LNEYDKLKNEVNLSTVPNFNKIQEKIDEDLKKINKSKFTNLTPEDKIKIIGEITNKYLKEYRTKNRARQSLLGQAFMGDKRNVLENEIFDYVFNKLNKPN